MKRIFIFLLMAIFLTAADSSLAVDKKKTNPKSKTTKVDVKKKPAAKINITKPKATAAKKVDKFIDKNKNGIDDRREKLKSKSSSAKKPTAKKIDPKKIVKPKKAVKKPVVKKKN